MIKCQFGALQDAPFRINCPLLCYLQPLISLCISIIDLNHAMCLIPDML